jgi:predicted nucleic-acid-binding protein
MKQVLLDTNVLMDFFQKRPEFFGAADQIFLAIRSRKLVGCISASMVTDLYYILGRKVSEKYAREVVEVIYATFRILAVNRQLIREALDSLMPDFEDAVQAVTVQKIGVTTVVTRDKEGFMNSGLRVYSPEEFLEELKQL